MAKQGSYPIWYATMLDNAGLKQGEADARRIWQNMQRDAANAGSGIEKIWQKTGAAIGGYLSARALADFARQMVSVRGQFQQLEIAFGTMLKSGDKAKKLMSDLSEFAATTPFGLQSSASAAKQLLAYGSSVETLIDEMRMLGDVAAGTSQPIGDLVYLYGTLRTQGRAYMMDIRQFAGRGIPIYDELAKVLGVSKDRVNEFVSAGKVGFAEVEQAFKNMTSSGGMYGGLMEAQSKSVTGRIEQLKDAVDIMFNEMGKASEGAIYGAISGAASLVENYEKVGRILAILVGSYGAYRAALIATVAIQKAVVAVEMIKTFNQTTQALTRMTQAQILLNKVVGNNPYIKLASILLTVGGLIWAFAKNSGAAAEEVSGLEKAMQSATKEFDEQQSKVQALTDIINDGNATYDARKKAIDDLKSIIPDYNAEINEEGKIINQNTDAIKEYLTQLERQIKMKAAQEELEENYRNKRNQEKELKTLREQLAAAEAYNRLVAAPSVQSKIGTSGLQAISMGAGSGTAKPTGNIEYQIEQTEKALSKTTDNINELNAEIEGVAGGVVSSIAETASTTISDSTNKAVKDAQDAERKLLELRIRLADDASQAEIDAMDDGFTKRMAQLRRNHELERAEIEKNYAELAKLQGGELTAEQQSQKTLVLGFVDDKFRSDAKAEQDAVLADMMTFTQRYEKIITDTNAKIKDAQMAGASLDMFGVLSDQENEAINRLAEEYAAKSTDYEAFMRLMVDASEKEINAQIDNARSLISQIIEGGIGEEEIEKYLGYVARLNALQDQLKTKKPDTNPEKESERDWKKLYSTLQKVEKEFNEIGDAVGGTAGEIISTAGTISTNTMQIIDGITSYSQIATQTITGVSITAANAIKAVEKASVILAIIGAIISVLQSVAKLFKKDDYMEKYLAEVAAVNEELARLKLNAKIDSEDRETIFGTDGWAKAKDGVDSMREALERYNDTLEEIAGRKEISILIDVNKVKSDIQSFDSLTDSIENMDVRIRHATWFRSAKYQSLKDAMPQLFNEDGSVNMDALKGFIGSDTFKKLSDTNQLYLERMSKDWETYQSAVEEVNNYLTDIFGDLGQNMSDALVDAFVNGTDAAMAFGDTVGDMLEQLAAQMVYSVTLGPLMEKYQKQFKDVMNNTEMTDEEKFANFTNILSNLTDDAIANQDLAQDLMQWAKDEAAKKGIEIFTPEEDTSETASRTSASQGFAQASQDSIDKIDGILTNIQNHTYGIFELMKSSVPGGGGSSIAFANIEAPVVNIAEMMRTNQQIQQANTDNILGRLTNIDMNTRELYAMRKDLHSALGKMDDMIDGIDRFTRG